MIYSLFSKSLHENIAHFHQTVFVPFSRERSFLKWWWCLMTERAVAAHAWSLTLSHLLHGCPLLPHLSKHLLLHFICSPDTSALTAGRHSISPKYCSLYSTYSFSFSPACIPAFIHAQKQCILKDCDK